jgi:hypothetical protein
MEGTTATCASACKQHSSASVFAIHAAPEKLTPWSANVTYTAK